MSWLGLEGQRVVIAGGAGGFGSAITAGFEAEEQGPNAFGDFNLGSLVPVIETPEG